MLGFHPDSHGLTSCRRYAASVNLPLYPGLAPGLNSQGRFAAGFAAGSLFSPRKFVGRVLTHTLKARSTADHVRMKAMRSSCWDVVIFDYGRVLSLTPSSDELQQFAALVGITEPPFFEVYSATRHDYDAGRADFRQHWQAFCDAAGVTLGPAQVERIAEMETLMWLRVNPSTLALAREIKAQGVRIAILSNMPYDLLAYVRREFDWLEEFEVKVWSCEVGATKPDPVIYRHCLDALGCAPERTLFFDDRPDNVEAARQQGMEAHIFESAEQAGEIVRAGIGGSSQ
jgi:putative hydrolase of the HAD superfamily